MSDRLVVLFSTWLTLPASWPVALAAAGLVFLFGVVGYHQGFRVLARFSRSTETDLDDLLLRRMRPPAKVLVFLVAVHVLLALRALEVAHVRSVVTVIELLLIAYLVIETAETFFFQWWLHERKQVPVPAVVRHLVLIVLYTAVVLTVLGSVTGMDLVPVLATSTVVTVVVGLALQDTLGNLFSGLALHIERPFDIGHWVLLESTEGQVTYMGWRSTHLRTLSGDIVVFPNAVVARGRVQNFSAPDPRTSRLVDLNVRLGADPDGVEAVVRAACATVAAVRADPPPRVWLAGVTPLFQRWVIKVWIDDFGVHDETESEVQKALLRHLSAAGLALGTGTGAPDGGGVSPALTPTGEVVASVVLDVRR